MSWHYSRALEAAFSAANYLDGAPSAPSNTMDTQETCSRRDKTTDASNPSQYGTMCEPSTGIRGGELLTWFLAGFPVRTSAAPETEKDSTGSGAAYGGTWRELFVRCDPATSSWKTHLCLWTEDLQPSCVTLPEWGMMQSGVCWEHIMPEVHTGEKGHGLWPTPRCTEARMKPRAPIPALLDGTRSHGWDLCEALWDAALTHNREWPGMVAPGEITEGGMPNPRYWEWLMGWPIGWTDVTQSATDKFRLWLHSHSAC